MKKLKYLLFDILYIFFWIVSYFSSLYLAVKFGSLFWQTSTWSRVLSVTLGYLSFLHFLVIIICLLKIIIQPKLKTGEFKIGANKDYLSWALNSLFMSLLEASPFSKQIRIIFYLNWLNYRLMGMKLPINTLVGMDTTIRQPELIEIGQNSIIGLGAKITCHYTPNGKTHVQQAVIVGDRSILGGYSSVAPNVTIGDDSVLGAMSIVSPHVKIGNRVKIGSNCQISTASSIPDDVKIKSNSTITKYCKILPGEIWEGSPAVKIGHKDEK